jgi:hypothetical protein
MSRIACRGLFATLRGTPWELSRLPSIGGSLVSSGSMHKMPDARSQQPLLRRAAFGPPTEKI